MYDLNGGFSDVPLIPKLEEPRVEAISVNSLWEFQACEANRLSDRKARHTFFWDRSRLSIYSLDASATQISKCISRDGCFNDFLQGRTYFHCGDYWASPFGGAAR
jgi:hypothetical protein